MISWLNRLWDDMFGSDSCDDCSDCCGDCNEHVEKEPRVHCTIYLRDGDTLEISAAVKEPGAYKEFDGLTSWFKRANSMQATRDHVYAMDHDYGTIMLRHSDIRRIEIDGDHKRS